MPTARPRCRSRSWCRRTRRTAPSDPAGTRLATVAYKTDEVPLRPMPISIISGAISSTGVEIDATRKSAVSPFVAQIRLMVSIRSPSQPHTKLANRSSAEQQEEHGADLSRTHVLRVHDERKEDQRGCTYGRVEHTDSAQRDEAAESSPRGIVCTGSAIVFSSLGGLADVNGAACEHGGDHEDKAGYPDDQKRLTPPRISQRTALPSAERASFRDRLRS